MIWAISGAALGVVLIIIVFWITGFSAVDRGIIGVLFFGTVGFIIGAYLGGILQIGPVVGAIGGFFAGLLGGGIVSALFSGVVESLSEPAGGKVEKILLWILIPLLLLSAGGGAYWGYHFFS